MLSLPMPIWRIGTSVALKRRMMGGVIPGGRVRTLLCEAAVIWATPVGTSAVGWKNTLITPMPSSDCDSMCSMPFTPAEYERSRVVTMRCSISSGDRP